MKALLAAAGQGDLAALRALLGKGARVDPMSGEDSPLMVAVTGGHLEAARLLLDAGADVNHRGWNQRTALHCAVTRGLAVIELLLAAGASVSGNLLSSASSPQVLALLVKGGIDPNCEWLGATILMKACEGGDVETVRLLLDRGADPNTRRSGTALTRAEQSGHQVVVDLLLEHGARPERPPIQPDGARDDAWRAARENPGDPQRRLAWAAVLARLGYRAAAASEVAAAVMQGASVPEALRSALEFQAPEGTRWTFAPFAPAMEGVAPMVEDARFPGARVTTGTETLPLVIVLGPACTCDEQGETVCSSCQGTGLTYGQFSDEPDYVCDPRQTCARCNGLRYDVVGPGRFGAGGCPHRTVVKELDLPPAVRPGVVLPDTTWPGRRTGVLPLSRCAACGLARLGDTFACGVCGLFACRCPRADSSPTDQPG